MSERKLVIISVDALNAKDHSILEQLPNFRKFIQQGAQVTDVRSVYPTVTYNCHTAILTGHYAHIHGIYNNEYPQPEKPTAQDWYWFEDNIKCPTLFDYARQANMTIATVLWPVMAGADVTWCVPEIWSPDSSVSSLKLLWQYATKNMILPVILKSHLMEGKKQPQLDDFTEAISYDLLRRKKPDITAIHLTELDSIRHIYGLQSAESSQSLVRLDQRIGRLMEATRKAGTYEQTNFILLGDHGTHDFNKVIEMNAWFSKEGLQDVYANSCGGSCQIHLLGKDPATEASVEASLRKLLSSKPSPIKDMLTLLEAKEQYGLSGDFRWVIEAQDGYVFRNGTSHHYLQDASSIPGCYKADHGYLPEHPDMRTLLFMMGPDIKKAAHLDSCSLVDEGPTFARLMGLTMEKTEGKVLDSLIRL